MNHRGFTLIELSIVLVIIGLIVGGILVGQDLIQGAKLRQVVSSHMDFQTRFHTFKLKYNCIPGDCPNATQFFGQSGNCDGSGPGVTVAADGTCNGNGDDWIVRTSNPSTEHAWVWSHLYHAGLAGGYVSNAAGGGTNIYSAYFGNQQIQNPVSKGNYVWFIGSSSATNSAQMIPSTTVCRNVGTTMKGIALQSTSFTLSGTNYYGPADTVQNAHHIDVKMDDGMPCTGRFHVTAGRAFDNSGWLNCLVGTGDTAAYDFTQTEVNCRFVFKVD